MTIPTKEFNTDKPIKIYRSKEGFEKVPVLRGFGEIENLFSHLYRFNVTFCGGYIRFMCSPKQKPFEANDIDLYCPDEETYEEVKKELLATKLEKRHENEISLTFKRPSDAKHPFFASPPIQLIKPMKEAKIVTKGTMEEILSNFDFTVIRIGLLDRFTALADADYIHDEEGNILRLKNIHCPVSSTLRCMKYSRKGYFLTPMNCLKLFLDWDSRDDTYRLKLIDFVKKSNEGRGLSKEDIEQMEAMMMID